MICNGSDKTISPLVRLELSEQGGLFTPAIIGGPSKILTIKWGASILKLPV